MSEQLRRFRVMIPIFVELDDGSPAGQPLMACGSDLFGPAPVMPLGARERGTTYGNLVWSVEAESEVAAISTLARALRKLEGA